MLFATAWTPVLASAALIVAKSTLLLCGAGLAVRVLGRGSAAARHLVWTLALAGLLLLPALVAVLPGWQVAFLAFLRPGAAQAAGWGGAAAASASPRLEPYLLAVWAAGALLVLGRLSLGLRAAASLARGAEPVEEAEWTDLLERMARAIGVHRPVLLLRSAETSMPLTWGALHPAILLPAEAEQWPLERRRVVLLHELAHVARRDCLVQTLAEICCALYWFHPGAWWAAREMRREREQACDDRVLASGARPSDYAGHLLDVARAYRSPAFAAAIAMARPSQLEWRLRAVLAAERDRRAVNLRTGAVCAVAVLMATLPLAAVAPSQRSPEPAAAPAVAWELPPTRSLAAGGERPEFRIVARVDRAPRPAGVAAPPRAAAPARAPVAAVPAEAPASPAPSPSPAAESAPAARPTLAARVDDDGRVHLALHGVSAPADLSRGLRVSLGGHGTTSAAVDIRLSPQLQSLVASVAAASKSEGNCPQAAARAHAGKKRVMARRPRAQDPDLALRMLGELNAALEGSDPPRFPVHGEAGG